MGDEIEKYMSIVQLSKNTSDIKECEDNDYVDNKVCVWKTIMNVTDMKTQNNVKDNIIKQYEISTEDVKTELSSSQIHLINDNLQIDLISTVDIKTELKNELLFCDDCNEDYQDYCIKCGMLVHILNRNTPNNTYNSANEEIPKDILEIKESFGKLGVYTLKVIPEGVRFGPFIGIDISECSRKIKGGRFIVSDDKLKFLNWMWYINPARSISEQNLLPFYCEGNLYYHSICKIQAGEELLVYFGEDYNDSLNNGVEMDFIPHIEYDAKNVFACTFCCLGFCSKVYLVKHKSVCPIETNGNSAIKDLVQCPLCKIYIEENEYFKYHETYCRENNNRKCIPSLLEIQRKVNRRKTQQRQTYKCKRCNYKTKYKSDLKNHTNSHYKVKIYKCETCYKRFKTAISLKGHMENTHLEDRMKHLAGINSKCMFCEYKTKDKSNLTKHIKTKHLKEFNYNCDLCTFKTVDKSRLDVHVNSKHLKKFSLKCTLCDYKTNNRSNLEDHIRTKHLKEFSYACKMCTFKTNKKYCLQSHMKTKHFGDFSFKCETCEYKTNNSTNLKYHVKTKHLNVFSYKCDICQYKTNKKANLYRHVKTKHLKEFRYKCDKCEYKTSDKFCLESHTKSKHFKEFDYKCATCEYQTNIKTNLDNHVKTKHLNEFSYKCDSCQYKTNYKTLLIIHIDKRHSKQVDYKCESCEFKTNDLSHLKRHSKETHKFKHKCASCEYETKDKSNLRRHVKTKHLNEFNYKCMTCDYKTNQKQNLEIHVKTKHLKEFDYNCEMCEFKSNSKQCLDRHILRKHCKENDDVVETILGV